MKFFSLFCALGLNPIVVKEEVPAPDHKRWILAHTCYYSWLSSYSTNSIRCVKEIISQASGGSVDRFKPMKLVDLALG